MKHLQTFEKFSLYQELFGKEEKNGVSNNDTAIMKVENEAITIGSKGSHVLKLQKSLEALGFKLWIYGVDGIFGNETLGQCKSLFSFLQNHSEFKDYVENRNMLLVKNNTITVAQQDLIHDLAEDDDLRKEIAEYFQELEKKIGDIDLIGKKEIMQHIEDPETFISKLYDISKKLQINPNWLLLVMWKESKINPRAINKKSNASGLIQFMPRTAKGLGTNVEKIQNMTGVQQLDYVYKFFKPYVGRIKSAQDLYMVTFFPAAMGKDDDFILQTKDLSAETVASQNKVVDLNHDNQITKGEFDEYVTKGLPKSWKQEADKKLAA